MILQRSLLFGKSLRHSGTVSLTVNGSYTKTLSTYGEYSTPGSGAAPSCDPTANGFATVSPDQVTVYIKGQDGTTMTETDGGNNWLRTDVNAGGAVLATYDANSLHFQMTDWEGTRRVQTDAVGNIEETCTNQPFGDGLVCTPVAGIGYDATEKHFTSQERDQESQNDYFGARYYASSMGRFMSPDPSVLAYADPTNPQSLNLYAYVRNNPLTDLDPTGLAGCEYYNGPSASVDATVPSQDDEDRQKAETYCGDDGNSGQMQDPPPVVPDGHGGYTMQGPSNHPGNLPPPGCSDNFLCELAYEAVTEELAPGKLILQALPLAEKFASCTFTAKVGLSIAATTLDAIGIIPGGNEVVGGVQIAAATVSVGLAVAVGNNGNSAALSGASGGMTAAARTFAKTEVTTLMKATAIGGSKMIPWIGNGVSAVATYYDIRGKGGLIDNYSSCFAGK